MNRPSTRKQKPHQVSPIQTFTLFLQRHLKFILIMVCSAAFIIILGINGLRSDVTTSPSQPSSQVASVASTQPLRLEQNANNSPQVPALAVDKMGQPSSLKGTIVQPPLPLYPIQKAPLEVSKTPQVQREFGHFPYQEADPSRLVNAGKFVRENYERSEQLDQEAHEAFQQMRSAAETQGIYLMIISGFRNISDQSVLFEKQIARRGSELEAARSSAPPGYSEHHTGYALDIADQKSDTDLKVAFQETAAYQWLMNNAERFQFEQSFPINNKQGVNFEPWHWRYIGPPRASQVFAAARQQ